MYDDLGADTWSETDRQGLHVISFYFVENTSWYKIAYIS
jgi:hypothetical protein